MSARSADGWQAHAEVRAAAQRIVAGLDAAAQALDHRAADRQSHAHAGLLGGEETVEQAVEVVAGDTLAEALDCRNAFVVAIFSERQAQALSVGSRVKVNADGWNQEADGLVERLVPRTTERVDLDYAVPFPPTERRELYAFIRVDGANQQKLARDTACSVGTWVSVSLPNEWLGKTQDYVHEASSSLLKLAHTSVDELPGVTEATWSLIETSRDRVFDYMGIRPAKQARQPQIAERLPQQGVLPHQTTASPSAAKTVSRTQS